MSLTDFVSLLISAILLGGLYATMSYGLALIYGVMKIVNIAHAGFMMLGAYAAYILIQPGYGIRLNPFLAPLIVVPLFFVIGMLLEKYIVRYVMNAPMITSLLLLFGVWLIIQNLAYIAFSGDTRTITTEYTLRTFLVGDLRISLNRLLVFAVGVVTLVILQVFLSRTYTGKAIRATASDADAAALVGVNTQRVQMIAFGLGIALASLAGSLMSLLFAFDPDFGKSHQLKSFTIVVLGGLESFVGVALGSLVLSLIESFSIPLGVAPAMQDFVSFALLVVVLVLMPGGLVALFKRR
ncbi:MAG: branched-chain amino acid ABC transporter permease [Chloroflexi bacterium]|nr:MAG: branched-chain amino acid ABC transporter permease [Chloroflexota bacterium]